MHSFKDKNINSLPAGRLFNVFQANLTETGDLVIVPDSDNVASINSFWMPLPQHVVVTDSTGEVLQAEETFWISSETQDPLHLLADITSPDTLRDGSNNLLFAYTRADALAAGEMICLSGQFPEICRRYHPVPIFCTESAWVTIELAAKVAPVEQVVGHILAMSCVRVRVTEVRPTCREFYVTLQMEPGDDEPDEVLQGKPVWYFRLAAGAIDIDNPNQCLTLMLPREDE